MPPSGSLNDGQPRWRNFHEKSMGTTDSITSQLLLCCGWLFVITSTINDDAYLTGRADEVARPAFCARNANRFHDGSPMTVMVATFPQASPSELSEGTVSKGSKV